VSDRELLELAAKAAGLKNAEYKDMEGWGEFRYGFSGAIWSESLGEYWNPLVNDGDALRLAAKLKISIDFHDCCAWSRGIFGLIQEFWGGDYPDCYRNAIVRAAAEIGRQK
jgi:hypothetical protein